MGLKIISADVSYLGKAVPDSGGGGGSAVIDELNVTPSTSAQTITAPSGTDGYSPVNVAAVTSSIDANIVAGNIKKDVSILGVTGTYEGAAPTGTMYIISNGTYNVADKAIANVNVPTTAPAHYIERKVDGTGALSAAGVTTPIDLTGVTIINEGALAWAYADDTSLTTAPDFSNITRINFCGLQYAFYNATNLTGTVDFSALKVIDGSYTFQHAFEKTQITNVIFKNLQSISATSFGAAFAYTKLVTVKFESLQSIGSGTGTFESFPSCTQLQSIWFYALTYPGANGTWRYMLSGDTNVTVHFPMAVQSTMSSWANVTAGFGGTNTTVLFDLVTSLTGADGNTYTRQEKDSTSTATAWVYNDTLYYTSGVSDNTNGVNEPTVGTTIYSDAACTTSVTTVSAIA